MLDSRFHVFTCRILGERFATLLTSSFFELPSSNFLTHEERQLAGLTQVEARVTGRPDPDAPLKQWGRRTPTCSRGYPGPQTMPKYRINKTTHLPPSHQSTHSFRGYTTCVPINIVVAVRSLRSERGTPRFRAHALPSDPCRTGHGRQAGQAADSRKRHSQAGPA